MYGKVRWALVAGLIVLIIASASLYYITLQHDKEVKIVPVEHLPDIIVATENEVWICSHDNVTNEYEIEATYQLNDIISMAKFQDNILMSSNSGLTLLDRELRRIDGLEIPAPLDIGVSGDIIYCCSNSSLYSISPGLSIMDGIYLKTTDWVGGKDAHDILIHNGSAYLLDNVITPIYVFKIDITDPWHMEMELGFEIVTINQHLRAQWLEPSTGRWFIIQHLNYMGGTTQNIICYSATNGSLLWDQEIYHWSWSNSEYDHGFAIEAITPDDPGWAIVSNDKDPYLMKFHSDEDSVNFQKVMDLSSFLTPHSFRWSSITQKGDLLFIHNFNQFLVVNVEAEPVIVLEQRFSERFKDLIIDTF